jgi:hypothetical protein
LEALRSLRAAFSARPKTWMLPTHAIVTTSSGVHSSSGVSIRKLRGLPGDLPFVLDQYLLLHGLNFTLDTVLGPLDSVGEVAGPVTFEFVDAHSDEVQVGEALGAIHIGLVRFLR